MNKVAFILTCLVAVTFLPSDAGASGGQGFLTPKTAPDSLSILPPPPEINSFAFHYDKMQYETAQNLRNSGRAQLAAEDADYANFSKAFSTAYGTEISATRTPLLFQLIRKVLKDSHDHAMKGAKIRYNRQRPFDMYQQSTCTPGLDSHLKTTGSYPSGHASFGWAAALILAEINPGRQTQILRRGYEFGESRVVCGAHWQSDVDAGRLMGAAVVAALHSNPLFLKKLIEVKLEFADLNL